MKRIVLLFVIGMVGLGFTAEKAEAQRSGSMQATARVVDTRSSWSSLSSARDLASGLVKHQQSPATVETSLSHVSMVVEPVASASDRGVGQPRRAQLTIQYLRN